MYFNELNLIPQLLRGLQQQGYQKPTPIQERSIPYLLEGRDLFGSAQTGTGKTAAFCIPLLQRLFQNKRNTTHTRALVLAPTRELAIQIDESFRVYGRYLPLRHTVIYGGVSQRSQTQALSRGVDIIVATPGRLLDLISQGHVRLSNIEILVLDEADRMLDMGFINDIRKIINMLPQKRQTILFSATLPKEIRNLMAKTLHNPVNIELSHANNNSADKVTQNLYFVDRLNKRNLLSHILKGDSVESALVFTRTKHSADKLARALSKDNIHTEAIHGNKSQGQRQRTLRKFKSKKLRVLVATDVASRGIDIDELSHVINFDLPETPETYVHRIGRTGRAGASGIAISFCGRDEMNLLKDIHSHLKKNIPVVTEHPFLSEDPQVNGPAANKSRPRNRRSKFFNTNSKFKRSFKEKKSA